MLVGLDHLVIAVPDPDAAAADLETRLGLAATAGGRHESGTWNRLIFLGDAYLELIGVWDEELAAGHPIGAAAVAVLAQPGGAQPGGAQLGGAQPGGAFATFALATDGILREVAGLHAAGSAISAPVAGSRVRPDGSRVAWQIAHVARLGPEAPPFLIEHEMAGPEWGEAARAARARFVHPFGGEARFVGLELAVADPIVTAAEWERAVGLRFAAAPDGEPGAREARVGDHRVRLVHLAAAGDPAPRAIVGIRATAGPPALVDACGIRFVRL